MILIIGGAYQGKLDFAINEYNLKDSDICDLSKESIDLSKKCLYHFERWVLSLIKEDQSPRSEYRNINLDDKIIITEDISSGIVPISPQERLWREETGRILVDIAKKSSSVIRIFAGIKQVLK